MLDRFTWIVDGLVVYPERMLRNCRASHGLFFSHRLLRRSPSPAFRVARRTGSCSATRCAPGTKSSTSAHSPRRIPDHVAPRRRRPRVGLRSSLDGAARRHRLRPSARSRRLIIAPSSPDLASRIAASSGTLFRFKLRISIKPATRLSLSSTVLRPYTQPPFAIRAEWRVGPLRRIDGDAPIWSSGRTPMRSSIDKYSVRVKPPSAFALAQLSSMTPADLYR